MPTPPEIWKEPKNAFSRRFLRQCSRRDGEPDTAAEAYHSVVWRCVPHPRLGHALVHPAEGPHQPPAATFFARHHALLAQAVLPFLGRDTLWRLGTDGQAGGHPVRVDGDLAGYFQVFNDNVVPYLVGADLFTRTPRRAPWPSCSKPPARWRSSTPAGTSSRPCATGKREERASERGEGRSGAVDVEAGGGAPRRAPPPGEAGGGAPGRPRHPPNRRAGGKATRSASRCSRR